MNDPGMGVELANAAQPILSPDRRGAGDPAPLEVPMEDGTINIDPVDAPEISHPTDDPKPTPVKKTTKRRAMKKRRAKANTGAKPAREQSGIGFVYNDLETAIGIARAMLDAGGVPLTRDQLAGVTNLSAAGGAFIMRVAAARSFGLVAFNQSRFELRSLGFEILGTDERARRAARAQAFLSVPLFARAYEEFKGKPLPPRPHGLESAFVRFGVPDKQRANARNAFDKSAKQAGFFDAGMDRLVEPIIGSAAFAGNSTVRADTMVIKADSSDAPVGSPHSSDNDESGNHPFIRGLIETLPPVRSDWPAEERGKWLRTAAHIFGLIYKGEGEISISVVKADTTKA